MNGYDTWTLKVPGRFDEGVAFLDLETVKVPTGGYRMANGENLAKRWAIVWAGIARDGEISLLNGEVDDPEFLDGIGDTLRYADAVYYAATREFDEMICRGRFTNARRAHEPFAFFPVVPGSATLPWRNLGSKPILKLRAELRGQDCESLGVTSQPTDLLMVHLLRDVVELIVAAGSPDVDCLTWCRRVLAEWGFAYDALFGPEE